MKIKTIRLANGRKFKTKWQYNDWHVEDIKANTNAVGEGVITLTFKKGAQTFKRIYAAWYVTCFDRKGNEVLV